MQRLLQPILCLAAALWLTCCCGCAASRAWSASPGAVAGCPCGECCVCKHNADLACVNVKITPDTPRTTYNGQTYYFCSEECKASFEKNPAKYVRK